MSASAPSIHHLAVVVRDLDRAEAFYGGVLGLAVERRWSDEAGAPRSCSEMCIGLGAHTHYWDRSAPEVAAHLDKLIR